jgi:hypothetical protein
VGAIREREVRSILDRVPPEIRDRDLRFLHLEAKSLFLLGKNEGGFACLERALTLCEQESDRLDLMITRATHLVLSGQIEESKALISDLEAMGAEASPLQQACILNRKALGGMSDGTDLDQLKGLWDRVLSIPATSGRALQFEHYVAYSNLAAVHLNHLRWREASRYAKLAMRTAAAHDFGLLSTFCLDLTCQVMTGPLTLQTAMNLDPRFIQHAGAFSILYYVYILANRAKQAMAYDAARRYFRYLKDRAIGISHHSLTNLSTLHLLDIDCLSGCFERAELCYDDLMRQPGYSTAQTSAVLGWAVALHTTGRTAEAETLLGSELERAPCGPSHDHLGFALSKLRGSAAPDLPKSLSTSVRFNSWQGEAYWQTALGLSRFPETFSYMAFGSQGLRKGDAEPLELPRRKGYALLGYLALNEEGIPSTLLAEHLFGGSASLKSIHTTIYSLRQELKTLGAEHLLETSGNWYRFKWSEVAYCDLQEFDALYQKARALETSRAMAHAATFYELALLQAPAPLFEHLPEEFGSARAAYQSKIERARSFVREHDPWLEG